MSKQTLKCLEVWLLVADWDYLFEGIYLASGGGSGCELVEEYFRLNDLLSTCLCLINLYREPNVYICSTITYLYKFVTYVCYSLTAIPVCN